MTETYPTIITPRTPETYTIVVGNIGTVFESQDFEAATRVYQEYCTQSESGEGRAGGEDVTLCADGEPLRLFSDHTHRNV